MNTSTPAPHHPLVWHSSFATLTGYSGSSLAFVLGLAERGLAVRPLYLYGADHDEQIVMGRLHPHIRHLQRTPLRLDVPQVVYAPGDRFSKNSGTYRIGFTMLETDRLPPTWVEQANQMDEIWTPTDWGISVFRTSGVQRPIHCIPLGIDTTHFTPGPARTRLRERTIFLSIFEWGTRKGWDILLRAYRAAFRPTDPVLLLLKIDCRDPSMNPIPELANHLPHPSPPVALLYNRPLTSAQLIELYQSADCFVLPTRGEGWGMPILEAMACGLPAIATDWSGPTAFLNAANGYPLPIRGLVPTNNPRPFYEDACWAEPDGDALTDLLRRIVTHPEERHTKGHQAARDAQTWSWNRGIHAIINRLTTLT